MYGIFHYPRRNPQNGTFKMIGDETHFLCIWMHLILPYKFLDHAISQRFWHLPPHDLLFKALETMFFFSREDCAGRSQFRIFAWRGACKSSWATILHRTKMGDLSSQIMAIWYILIEFKRYFYCCHGTIAIIFAWYSSLCHLSSMYTHKNIPSRFHENHH